MFRMQYLARRKGSRNLYYKRQVPNALRAPGRPNQIWRSLQTADPDHAKIAYRRVDLEIDQLFAKWDETPTPSATAETAVISSPILSPASSVRSNSVGMSANDRRRILANWNDEVIERDFKERGDLWALVAEDREALKTIAIRTPREWPYDPFDLMWEDNTPLAKMFAYVMMRHTRDRLTDLETAYRLGQYQPYAERLEHLLNGFELDGDRRRALLREAMCIEIKVLKQILADDPVASQFENFENSSQNGRKDTSSAPRMSSLIERYVDEAARSNDWSTKDRLRWRSMLNEFIQIAGDKNVDAYASSDGADFKAIEVQLPARRNVQPYAGKTARECIRILEQQPLLKTNNPVRLSPSTVKDKLGCVDRFFQWAHTHYPRVQNPVIGVKIARTKKRNRIQSRVPWTIESLNKMFAAPVYTGAESLRRWHAPGAIVLSDTAMYWAPLIALFSGLRLGEIIQLHTDDIKQSEGIDFFEISIESNDTSEENRKSLKTNSSRRRVPIHRTLRDLGFLAFVQKQRSHSIVRLFPEFRRAQDDKSWSKPYSKYFKRFRDHLDIDPRMDFHALRHNAEDALRNAGVHKQIRDALQGHVETGTGAHYGEGYSLDVLSKAVQSMRYDNLRLPKRINDG